MPDNASCTDCHPLTATSNTYQGFADLSAVLQYNPLKLTIHLENIRDVDKTTFPSSLWTHGGKVLDYPALEATHLSYNGHMNCSRILRMFCFE